MCEINYLFTLPFLGSVKDLDQVIIFVRRCFIVELVCVMVHIRLARLLFFVHCRRVFRGFYLKSLLLEVLLTKRKLLSKNYSNGFKSNFLVVEVDFEVLPNALDE